MVRLASDQRLDPLMHLERGQNQLMGGSVLTDTGEQVEECGGIFTDVRAASQQAQVRIKSGGRRIVIAGAQMDIAAKPIVISTNHQTHLGMDLVSHHAVDHVNAGLFEAAGPGDVVGLVKSCLQFHHYGDLLAVLHRIHEGSHDAAIAARAIKGLLDSQNARIGRCLLEEL